MRLLCVAVDAEVAVPAADLGRVRQKRKAGGAATGASATGASATGASTTGASATRERKWYYQARRFRLERDNLAQQLRRFSGDKHSGNISEELLLRVILVQPNASARWVEQSFADVVGSDVRAVSSFSIDSVRDAWVELYKPMVLRVAAELVATCAACAAERKAVFAPV